MSNWRPTSSIENIQLRAQLLSLARSYFYEQKILEVETPLLGSHTVTDPNIESFTCVQNGLCRFLQTSPEYAMKRLLAAGSPDIYQICKSFRIGESGSLHNPEFTLIEWYRLGFSLDQIIQDTINLLYVLLEDEVSVDLISYNDAFLDSVGISLCDVSDHELQNIAENNGLATKQQLSQGEYVDFVFSHCVIPEFSSQNFTVVKNYPASQAALAKLNACDSGVSERFEIFYRGVELANGYHELTDFQEQQQRFENDMTNRKFLRKSQVTSDQRLLDAMKYGLPDCAGVAVGFDRVMMIKSGASSISDVISFDWNSA